MAYIPCVYWLVNKPPGDYIASDTFGSSWVPTVCIDLSVWFLLNISHPALLHRSCMCYCSCAKPSGWKWKITMWKMKGHLFQSLLTSMSPLSHWSYTCIIHLPSIEQLLIYICMCEKLNSLRGYGSSVLQRIRSLLQQRPRYSSSKRMDA